MIKLNVFWIIILKPRGINKISDIIDSNINKVDIL